MTTYDIDHDCGHRVQVSLVRGARADRLRAAALLERQPCRACWVRAQIARGNAAVDALDASELGARLPALEGTEKQVAWATRVRATALKALVDGAPTASSVTGRGLDLAARAAVARITDASWFCDRGRASVADVLLGAIGWWIASDRAAAIDTVSYSIAPSIEERILAAAAAAGGDDNAPTFTDRDCADECEAIVRDCLQAWGRHQDYQRERAPRVSIYDAQEALYGSVRTYTTDYLTRIGVDPLSDLEF